MPIKDKTPEVTAAALRAMLNKLGNSPVIISSDAGNEFTGAVQTLLEQKDIVHRVD